MKIIYDKKIGGDLETYLRRVGKMAAIGFVLGAIFNYCVWGMWDSKDLLHYTLVCGFLGACTLGGGALLFGVRIDYGDWDSW